MKILKCKTYEVRWADDVLMIIAKASAWKTARKTLSSE